MTSVLLTLAVAVLGAPPARADAPYVFAECGNGPETKKLAACACGSPAFGPVKLKIQIYNQGKVPLDEMSLFVNSYIDDAGRALKKFNLKLDLDAQFDVTGKEGWDKPIREKSKLCALVDDAFKAHPASDRLPVFFLYLDSDMVLGGDAVGQNFNPDTSRIECGNYRDVTRWPDFIVISNRVPKTTVQVLVHEMGHALGQLSGQTGKFAHRGGDSNNLMLTGRSVEKAEDVSMTTEQLSVFCGSKFAAQ